MAKGDHARQQNQLDSQGGTTQNNLNNLRTNLTRQNQGMENRFNTAADQATQDYGNLMGQGQNYYNTTMNEPLQNFESRGGYQDFANTGGFSAQDLQNIRARSVAPMRAVYANANAAVDRERALQGGYAPNAIAARAKMARELSSNLGDAATNVEAGISDQVHQGKLAGLSGLTNIDNALLGARTARLGLGGQALSGMSDLYGKTPGMANMAGNQLLTSSGQQLQTEGLQNDVMKNYIQGQNNVANTTGNFQSAMGNVSSGLNAVGTGANLFNPMKQATGGGKSSSGMGNSGYQPNDTNGWG